MSTVFRQLSLVLAIIALMTGILPASAQELSSEEIITQVTSTAAPEIIQTVPSPDGTHEARVSVYPCTDIGSGTIVSYEILELVEISSGTAQKISEQTIYCGGLGAFGLSVVRWSIDGSVLFFTDAREGTPDGFAGGWSAPLWRVRIADLNVENLGSAVFSPYGTLLALWDAAQVRVMAPEADLSLASSFPLSPEGLRVTALVWLPDASGFIYVQADSPFGAARSTVTHVDLASQEQTVVVNSGS